MPLPTLVLLGFATGMAAALAARVELHESPHPVMLTRPFWAWVLFAGLVLLPISAYFYVFHGDWFLLYQVDVALIPSAVALLLFFAEGAFGALGFFFGAALVRGKRPELCGALLALFTLLAAAPVVHFRRELSVVGTHRQFHRGYGLEAFTETSLYPGSVLMGTVLALGLGFLLARLALSRRAG